jgi:FecR protein/Putative zinc-finger
MTQNKQDLDAIIDKAAFAIRDEQIDQSAIDESAARVWARISQGKSTTAKSYSEGLAHMNASNNEVINGCDDFRSLMPAYLNGELSTARKLLLEDHSNECIPCRNELKAQKAAKTATYVAPRHTPSVSRKPLRSGSGQRITSTVARWSVAAVLAIAILGIGGSFLYERLDLSGHTLAATVDNVNGQAYVVSETGTRQIATGEQLQKGETLRTAKDSNAVLRMVDGSTIETRERSEFSVSENMRGVTIKLDRGDVIIEAAKQKNGRLYVQTPDSLVSVKGTIFSVESGTKGSRVSVVEGEVKVDHAGVTDTLLPGDQTTTSPNIEKTSVNQTVAWSRNASKYSNLVSDLAKLRQDVNQKVARPGVRHSSRFLDLVPENTVFYAALPNLTQTLADSQKVMEERIKQNPALADWWKNDKGHGIGLNSQTMQRIHEFGSQLGDEIVVTASMDAKGEPSGILVLGEVKDGPSFRAYLNDQLTRFAQETKDLPSVRIVDDPAKVTATTKAPTAVVKKESGPNELFVWLDNDIFAASPQIETLRSFAETSKNPSTNGFTNSSFHQRLSDVYKDGAGLIVAADLEKIISQVAIKTNSAEEQRNVEGLKQLGVMNLRNFIAEQKEVNGRTLSQAALTFTQADHGIPSWLAAPGPMGALDFISPNANVVTAFVVNDPAKLVDDLFGFVETVQPDVRQHMQEVEKQQGFSIRDDFAAPLGGEFAFAIDGPILPTPSWKVVLEVYDQAKLQDSFERAISKLNQFSTLSGKGSLALESSVDGDRTFYVIKSSATGLEVSYTYSNGYLIAAPSRALLDQSLRNRDAGNTLVHSARFISSLPQDGNANFSAILYHDLAPLIGPLAEKMKNAGTEMSDQQRQKLASIDVNAPPTLVYAYALGDRITVSANTEGGAFGLSPASLIGLPNSFEMQHILMNAMDDKDVKKTE